MSWPFSFFVECGCIVVCECLLLLEITCTLSSRVCVCDSNVSVVFHPYIDWVGIVFGVDVVAELVSMWLCGLSALGEVSLDMVFK